jgi:hypothetical protein
MDKGKKRNERSSAGMLAAHSCLSFLLMPVTVWSLLNQPSTITVLQKADPSDPGIADLIQQINQIDPKINNVSHFQVMVQADHCLSLDRGVT